MSPADEGIAAARADNRAARMREPMEIIPQPAFSVELEPGKFLTERTIGEWGATHNLNEAQAYSTKARANGAMGRAGKVVHRSKACVVEVEVRVTRAASS